MSAPEIRLAVAEIQGTYGPFTFSEMLFQKIWAEMAFDQSQLRTLDGRHLRLRHQGKWNLLGGPDFKQARWQWDDAPEVTGDVELHLHAEDWRAHGHAEDPAYDDVKLHVVLFPPKSDQVTRGRSGQSIPVLVLLPWLHHDLEEYAAEDAVEKLANRSEMRVLAIMRRLPEAQLRVQLDAFAEQRWRQKLHFASLRVAKVGWAEACHQTALEILGFRYNRVPMLRLATRFPLKEWGASSVLKVEDLVAGEEGRWSKTGVRPANLPRVRLQQYQNWTAKCPDWPQQLQALAAQMPMPTMNQPTAEVRRRLDLREWRECLLTEICGGALGGTRLDTMICDGLLPLLATQSGCSLGGLWYHWFLGDAPHSFVTVLRDAGRFSREAGPSCHGAVQGLIGWILAQEKQTPRLITEQAP